MNLRFTCRNIPSDGFDLADEVGEFAVSCVRQEHADNGTQDANCAKNDEWQSLTVHI